MKQLSIFSLNPVLRTGVTLAAAAIITVSATTTTQAVSPGPSVVFDNISDYENSVPGVAVNATGSTPNSFMGDAYTLAPGTTQITGFDLLPANLSGVNYTGLKINIFVWGTVNTGTVNATTPAFGDDLR